jgi:hypothetical protein
VLFLECILPVYGLGLYIAIGLANALQRAALLVADADYVAGLEIQAARDHIASAVESEFELRQVNLKLAHKQLDFCSRR